MSQIEISIRPDKRPFDQLVENRQGYKRTQDNSFYKAGLSEINQLSGGATASSLPTFEVGGMPLTRAESNVKETRSSIGLVSDVSMTTAGEVLRKDKPRQPEAVNANTKNDDHLFESKMMRRFQSPDCQLDFSVKPDGTIKTVYTTAEGSTLTKTNHSNGNTSEEVSDRYNRQIFVRETHKNGSWTKEENQYQDSRDKISPFLASKRIAKSDGTVSELTYDWHGGIAKRVEYTNSGQLA
jgi:hypothetical protein